MKFVLICNLLSSLMESVFIDPCMFVLLCTVNEILFSIVVKLLVGLYRFKDLNIGSIFNWYGSDISDYV